MEFDSLVEIAKNHGIKIGFLNKNLYKILAPKIPPEEKIISMAEGLDSKSANKAPIIVTSKNVYIIKYSGVFGGIDCLLIPINKISSVSSSGAILAKICINEGTVIYEIQNVDRNKAELIINSITLNQKENNTVISNQLSSADEIKKFKSLLDEGIISQSEFEKKKKELLGL